MYCEHEVKSKNEALGWVLTLLTEVTERADTRSWLLLPANIQITQVLVPPGVTDVELTFKNAWGQVIDSQKHAQMTFERGKTTFLIHRTF